MPAKVHNATAHCRKRSTPDDQKLSQSLMLLGFAGIGFMAYRRKSKPVLMAA
jgi:hypothetical protein